MSTATPVPGFNSAKAEAFASKPLMAANHGAVCLMASIGHRTGRDKLLVAPRCDR